MVYLDLCGQSNLPGYGGQGRGAQGQGCEVAIWVGENQAKKEKKRMPCAALVRLLNLWIGLIKNEDFVFGDFVLKSYGSNSISKDTLRDVRWWFPMTEKLHNPRKLGQCRTKLSL